jgi:ribosomal-protein-alanine N-acetyltransferase
MSISPPSQSLEIRTELSRCRLRPWAASDESDLVRHANSRSVWRNLLHSFPHPYTQADARSWIAHTNANPGLHYAIEVDGAALGGIGIVPQEGLSVYTAHFGYWLGEPAWGRGIATAAARAMASQVFSTFPFARLEASVFAWNAASMRVLEKSGFSREGVLRHSVFKDGELIDSVMYAKLRVGP